MASGVPGASPLSQPTATGASGAANGQQGRAAAQAARREVVEVPSFEDDLCVAPAPAARAAAAGEARLAKLRKRAASGWPPGWGPPLGWLAAQAAAPDAEAEALTRATQAAVDARQLSVSDGAARLVDHMRRKVRRLVGPALSAPASAQSILPALRAAAAAPVMPRSDSQIERPLNAPGGALQEAELQARLAAAAHLRAQQQLPPPPPPLPPPRPPAPAPAPRWPSAAPLNLAAVAVSDMWSEFGAGAVPEQLQALWSAGGLGFAAEPPRQSSRLPLYERVAGMVERADGGTAAVGFCESENGNGIAHAWAGPQLRDLTLH